MAAPSGPLGGAVPDHRRARTVPHRRRSRFRMRDWRMRTKLAAVLSIPSAAFLVLAGVQTGSLIAQATELNEFAAEVGVADEISRAGARRCSRSATAPPESSPRRGPTGAVDAGRARRRACSGFQIDVDDAAQRFRARRRAAGPRRRLLAGHLHPVGGADRPAAGAAHRGDRHRRAADDLRQLQPDDRRAARRCSPSRRPAPSQPELSAGGAAQRADRPGQGDRLADPGRTLRRRAPAAATRPTTWSRSATCGPSGSRRSSDFRIDALPAQAAFYDDVSVTPAFVAGDPHGGGRPPAAPVGPLLDADPWWTASQDRFEQLLIIEERVLDDAADVAGARSGEQLRRTLLVAGR